MSWKHFERLVSRYCEKTGFTGYVYDFRVDCDSVSVDDIKNVHKY